MYPTPPTTSSYFSLPPSVALPAADDTPSSLLTDSESKTSLRCLLLPAFLPLGSVKRRTRTDGGGRVGFVFDGGMRALHLGLLKLLIIFDFDFCPPNHIHS